MEKHEQTVINVPLDETLCYDDRDDALRYLHVLEGIMWSCVHDHGFREGYRNTVIVDLTVSCSMLGIDELYVLSLLNNAGAIDYRDDDEDTEERMSRVLEYWRKFDYDYMIDPDHYRELGEQHSGSSSLPVLVVLK